MSLYPDQIAASQKFEECLNNTDVVFMGLWASAGFGKSYSAKDIIDEVIVKNSNYIPVLTSMTHGAVAILADFTGRKASTLHGLMGWVPQRDPDTGEEFLQTPRMRDKNAPDRLGNNMLVIVDEAGLMGHDELELLRIECERTGARVLFIGDNKQCYPVMRDGQKLCVPAYEATEVYLELTIPKRVDKEDTIYQLSLAYRRAVDGADQPKLKTKLNKDGKTGVRYVQDIEEYAYKAFEAGKRDGNMREIKVMAFTNQRCLNLNRKIRKKVMGLTDPTPVVGEEMVANTAVQNGTGDETLIRNNQLVIVKEVEATDSYGLKGAFIQFEYYDSEHDMMVDVEEVVFVPSTPSKLLSRLKELANEAKALKAAGDSEGASAKWRAFYSLKEGVSDIRFTYAITVNKAQGITLKHALIDLDDINQCWDREQKTRMAYTAVTRATTYVTIEGELT